MLFHELKIGHHIFVVTDSVHHVFFGEFLQPAAWEIGALEAPGDLLAGGAAAEAVAAVAAVGIDIVGKAPVAADGFHRDVIGSSHLPQFFQILIVVGQVPGTGSTIEPADSD